jgi:hypothetical protein
MMIRIKPIQSHKSKISFLDLPGVGGGVGGGVDGGVGGGAGGGVGPGTGGGVGPKFRIRLEYNLQSSNERLV